MTNQCACGSYAINPHEHGREDGVDLDLCDVCYWRKRAGILKDALHTASVELSEASDKFWVLHCNAGPQNADKIFMGRLSDRMRLAVASAHKALSCVGG